MSMSLIRTDNKDNNKNNNKDHTKDSNTDNNENTIKTIILCISKISTTISFTYYYHCDNYYSLTLSSLKRLRFHVLLSILQRYNLLKNLPTDVYPHICLPIYLVFDRFHAGVISQYHHHHLHHSVAYLPASICCDVIDAQHHHHHLQPPTEARSMSICPSETEVIVQAPACSWPEVFQTGRTSPTGSEVPAELDYDSRYTCHCKCNGNRSDNCNCNAVLVIVTVL